MEKEKSRNKSIDLMKSILTFFVILHHLLLRGPISLRQLLYGEFNINNSCYIVVNAFLVVAVNCFFISSGYFGIKRNKKKLIMLISSIYFFNWTISLISLVFLNVPIKLDQIKSFIFPLGDYWFALTYCVLYIVAPIIEDMLQALSKNELSRISIIFFCVLCLYGFITDNPVVGVNSGYSIIFSLYLYLIGYLIRTNFCFHNHKNCLVIYAVLAIINSAFALAFIYLGKQELAWKIFSYNNPLVVFGSICFFVFFKNLNSEIINKNKMSFGRKSFYIYIIHSTPAFANWYIGKMNELYSIIPSTLFVVMIFLFSILIISYIAAVIYEKLWNSMSSHFFNNNSYKA